MFKVVLDAPMPEALVSLTEDVDIINERDQNIFWKLKAQAARITQRLFSKNASTNYAAKNDKESPWLEHFQANFAEMLCESHLQLVFSKSTNFVGSKTLSFAIKLVSLSTKIPLTMAKMLPFID